MKNDLELADILAEYKGKRGALIPILQKVQEKFGYLPREAIKEIVPHPIIPPSMA